MRVAPKIFHQTILAYRNFHYAWWALALGLASWFVYLFPNYEQPANGGTWQGYTLGTVSALLIVWLLWLGVRKRRYANGSGTLQGWVSAHVYLGTALLWVATLHTGFQFGWNLHTLAYGLMAVVIGSGLLGIWAYLAVPARMVRKRDNRSRDDLLHAIVEVDRQCLRLAQDVHPDVGSFVQSALDRTVLGGSLLQQLSGRDRSSVEVRGGKDSSTAQRVVPNRNQDRVIRALAERLARSPGGKEAVLLQELLWLFARRKTLLQQVRADVRLQGWLQLWLLVHVPLSLALLVALALHIFSVFYYW